MITSILDSIKKVLNLESTYTAFDQDIILHINSVFSTLNELGIGPEQGFMIEDKDATWNTFLGDDPRLNNVKSYVYLRVRMLFDPPTLGYLIEAMERQIKEFEWRLNAYRESTQWVDPSAEDLRDTVLDGGGPYD
jgi:hypothetical protein